MLRHVDNPMGLLIEGEIGRAEADLLAVRSRAQGVLAISSGLVTLLAGLIALASGRDAHLALGTLPLLAAAVTVLGFLAATGMVLAIFGPVKVIKPGMKAINEYVNHTWGEQGWDRDVAIILAEYLASLRSVNETLAKKLTAAIRCLVAGVCGVTLMALILLTNVRPSP